jgi:hypothetical protein
MLRTSTYSVLALAALILGSCDSLTSPHGAARVTVLLTDAPHAYLESAVVTIDRVEILPMDGPAVVISTDGGTHDLLELQDGVTAELGSAVMDAGLYHQLRLIVSHAEVTLKDGYEFTDGSTTKTIHVPSGAQTGIKVNLSAADGGDGEGVEIRPGEMVLVVDFDVSQNFVMQGSAETPAGIHGFLFTPLLRAVVEDVAGSIEGTVTAPEDVDTEGLTVLATREGAAQGEAAVTTVVKEDGAFKLHFLPPGTYEVTIDDVPEGYSASVEIVEVGKSEDVTGVELVITEDD